MMKWTRPLPTDGTRFLTGAAVLVEIREANGGYLVVNDKEFCPSAEAVDSHLADKYGDGLPQLTDE